MSEVTNEIPLEEEPDLTELDNFHEKVNHVYTQIHGDEEKRDLVLAEIHVFMATFDQAIRKMLSAGGPMAFFGKMMGAKTE